MNRGDICMASNDKDFELNNTSGEDLWEEIDERLWMTNLLKAPHFHDDEMKYECSKNNLLEAHEVERLVMVKSIDGDKADVIMLDLAKNDWVFDPTFMTPADAFLDAATTGLTHSFIVQTDITFPIETHQLSQAIFTMPENLCDEIDALGDGKQTALKVGTSMEVKEGDWKANEAWDAEKIQTVLTITDEV